MKVAVAGSSGFIGKALCRALEGRGDAVVRLRRDGGDWAAAVDGADGVVNLCGAGVADRRWTSGRKRLLRDSRLGPTAALAEAFGRCARRPAVLVNASAVGYYGDAGDAALDESAPNGADFLAVLCRDWEAQARRAEAGGTRVVLARFGVVLGPGGGALPRMALPFKLFAGGPLGSGRQWLSWVALDDAVAALLFALDRPSLSGPVNVVAPQPLSNRDFSAALGRSLGRPSWLPAPAFALRLALGELSGMLLGGQRVLPRRLEREGFRFQAPSAEAALAQFKK